MVEFRGSDAVLKAGRLSHSPSSPSAVTLFLSRRFSRVRSATTSLSAVASRRSPMTSSEVAAPRDGEVQWPALAIDCAVPRL